MVVTPPGLTQSLNRAHRSNGTQAEKNSSSAGGTGTGVVKAVMLSMLKLAICCVPGNAGALLSNILRIAALLNASSTDPARLNKSFGFTLKEIVVQFVATGSNTKSVIALL